MAPRQMYVHILADPQAPVSAESVEFISREYLEFALITAITVEPMAHRPSSETDLGLSRAWLCSLESPQVLIEFGQYLSRKLTSHLGDSAGGSHSIVTVFIYPALEPTDEYALDPVDIHVSEYGAKPTPFRSLIKQKPKGVRLTHVPTGSIADCDCSEYRHKNIEKAFHMLRSQLVGLKLMSHGTVALQGVVLEYLIDRNVISAYICVRKA